MNQLRPRQGFPTFVELLRHRAALQGDRTAFVYLEDGERPTPPLTYRDLEARARAVLRKDPGRADFRPRRAAGKGFDKATPGEKRLAPV